MEEQITNKTETYNTHYSQEEKHKLEIIREK